MLNTVETSISRRGLLKAVGTGAVLLVGFEVPRVAKGDDKAAAPVNPLKSWVRIDQSGTVTLMSARSEMGQGISSALPMVLAEVLGMD